MTLEEIRQRLSGRLGIILKTLLDLGADSRFIIIGGDTLLAFMDAIQCRELYPVQELCLVISVTILLFCYQLCFC